MMKGQIDFIQLFLSFFTVILLTLGFASPVDVSKLAMNTTVVYTPFCQFTDFTDKGGVNISNECNLLTPNGTYHYRLVQFPVNLTIQKEALDTNKITTTAKVGSGIYSFDALPVVNRAIKTTKEDVCTPQKQVEKCSTEVYAFGPAEGESYEVCTKIGSECLNETMEKNETTYVVGTPTAIEPSLFNEYLVVFFTKNGLEGDIKCLVGVVDVC